MLHEKESIRHNLLSDVFASSDLAVSAPKYRFPTSEMLSRDAYQLVHDELLLDGNARQNLATFVQTWMEPEIEQIMRENIGKNIVDKDEYPRIAELEARCVHMLADLWNAPDALNTIGTSTVGSSEAAMLGGMAAKWRWRARRRAQGLPTERPNIVTGTVQVCWHKFARYWDIELREIPVEADRYTITPDEVLARCDENTMLVVPTLGLTCTLQYEPVQAIAAALDALQCQGGPDIPIHVDAASGGFLAPFVAEELCWDFRLPRVKSINASGHKFGLAPVGVGWIVWRDKADLPEDLIFKVNYLGGDMATFALNFSRPGGQVAAQYYNFMRLGRDGYRTIQQACYRTAEYLAARITKMGPFTLIYDGKGGIPGVTWTLCEGVRHPFTLFDLSDRLRCRGWQVPAYSLPANAQEVIIQRVLARHDFSRDLADLLADDIERSLEYFAKNPVSSPLTEGEAGGYRH